MAVDIRLPLLFQQSNSTAKLIAQGAEGLLYQTQFLSSSCLCALKVRPRKEYRHPALDRRLTRQRLLTEARILVRCAKEGVSVPGVLGADWDAGWLAIEWIDGEPIRVCLDRALKQLENKNASLENHVLHSVMDKIGAAVGKLHETGLTHGDLTTSNMVLQGSQVDFSGDVFLIDFGLAGTSFQDEDRAVDLYVLERAFSSTHPQADALFQRILRAYQASYPGAKGALRRLDDVRLRGRKKSLIG